MIGLFALAAAAVAATPAPPIFVSGKAVTFRSPPGTTICPLSDDWVGSDHGTTLFLEPPKGCGGTGFPSSARHWDDDRLTRHMAIFYAYWMGEDEPPPPACQPFDKVTLMGSERQLCASRIPGGMRLWARARYVADSESWMEVSLTTRGETLPEDLRRFRAWTTSIHACRIHWRAEPNAKKAVFGPAPDCPPKGVFF
jgi:hypothetical protein